MILNSLKKISGQKFYSDFRKKPACAMNFKTFWHSVYDLNLVAPVIY